MNFNVIERDLLGSSSFALSSVANDVLHSALRRYYFELKAEYKVYEDCSRDIPLEFLSAFNACKFLLRQLFGDEVVKDENYNDLPF